MTNIKNNLEKEVNRISSEWIKILYDENKEVENTDITTIKPVELDFEYLLGFYEGITRKTPPLNISFENLKGFYDAIQLVCKVHLKDKK